MFGSRGDLGQIWMRHLAAVMAIGTAILQLFFTRLHFTIMELYHTTFEGLG